MLIFFQLIRITNLLIIAATMYAIRFCFFSIGGKINGNTFLEQILFFSLVLSTLLIAGAGNIINDYFDIKSDKINKPEHWIIGNIIPKRKAILYQWIFNVIAFSIAVVLSLYYHTFWYVFIHLFSINILWLYSIYFKKKALIGNLIVAFLTALVVILSGIHFAVAGEFTHEIPLNHYIITTDISYSIYFWKKIFLEGGKFIWIFAFFSFLLNLSREIIKDIEDIEGDKILLATTLPLKYGIKKTKLFALITLITIPIAYISLVLHYKNNFNFTEIISTLPVAIAVIISIISIILLIKAKTNNHFKTIDRLLKIAMVFGILTPFYWWFF
jgi:4-hydroxybenzoate polyprenyltransferase